MEQQESLQGYQRAALMKRAHHLNPVVTIGRNGASSEVRDHLARELHNHELIKMRFTDHKEQTRMITEELAAELDAHVVTTIGYTAVLYRRNPDPEQRQIVLPERL